MSSASDDARRVRPEPQCVPLSVEEATRRLHRVFVSDGQLLGNEQAAVRDLIVAVRADEHRRVMAALNKENDRD